MLTNVKFRVQLSKVSYDTNSKRRNEKVPTITLDKLLTLLESATIRIVNRDKNRLTRYRLGITVDEQIDLIRSLEKSDYKSGPEADHDGTEGSIWVFSKKAYGEIFYIKLKHDTNIKAISCHIEEK